MARGDGPGGSPGPGSGNSNGPSSGRGGPSRGGRPGSAGSGRSTNADGRDTPGSPNAPDGKRGSTTGYNGGRSNTNGRDAVNNPSSRARQARAESQERARQQARAEAQERARARAEQKAKAREISQNLESIRGSRLARAKFSFNDDDAGEMGSFRSERQGLKGVDSFGEGGVADGEVAGSGSTEQGRDFTVPDQFIEDAVIDGPDAMDAVNAAAPKAATALMGMVNPFVGLAAKYGPKAFDNNDQSLADSGPHGPGAPMNQVPGVRTDGTVAGTPAKGANPRDQNGNNGPGSGIIENRMQPQRRPQPNPRPYSPRSYEFEPYEPEPYDYEPYEPKPPEGPGQITNYGSYRRRVLNTL